MKPVGKKHATLAYQLLRLRTRNSTQYKPWLVGVWDANPQEYRHYHARTLRIMEVKLVNWLQKWLGKRENDRFT